MEIKIEDYLNEQEIKDILKDELRSMIRGKGNDDLQRVVGNVAHEIVVGLVNEHFNQELETMLKDKVVENIETLSSYTVFKKPDAWERTPSSPYNVLERVVNDNKHLVKERFEQLVGDLTIAEDFQVDFDYEVRQLLMSRLFGDKWTDEL